MTERTQQGATPAPGKASAATPAPSRTEARPTVDIEKIADKVYRMMLLDLALARERGGR